MGSKGDLVPDEGDVYSEAAVDGGAVEAEEDAVGDGGPGGVLGVAVEAHLRCGAVARVRNRKRSDGGRKMILDLEEEKQQSS